MALSGFQPPPLWPLLLGQLIFGILFLGGGLLRKLAFKDNTWRNATFLILGGIEAVGYSIAIAFVLILNIRVGNPNSLWFVIGPGLLTVLAAATFVIYFLLRRPNDSS